MSCLWQVILPWHLLRRLKFQDAVMEQTYQTQAAVYYVSLAPFLAFIFSFGGVVFLILRGAFYDWFKGHPVALALHFLPIANGVVLLLASAKVQWFGKHFRTVIYIACTVVVGWSTWSTTFMGSLRVKAIPKDFPKVWSAIEAYPEAQDELMSRLSDELLLQQIWFHLVMLLYSLSMLQYLGLSYAGVAAYASLPLCYNIMAFMLINRMSSTADIVLQTISISFYLMFASLYWAHIHRRQFEMNHVLQQTLAKEAQAMESLAHQEKAHKKMSQHADSILNHILKNMMADAAGCIHLYIESLLGEPPKDLVQAVTCLDRGMSWCRRRQALLQVASKDYVPMSTPVALRQFVMDVVSGREVTCTFIDAVVNLDTLLCEIVLDNAISNAFRHGHPDDPQVTLSVSLSQTSSDEEPVLKFTVANRANPVKPPVTPYFISQTLAGELRQEGAASSPISEQIGLQHMFMAAEAHDISLSLKQEGNTVKLQASMLVTLGPEERIVGQNLSSPTAQLPEGLRILCIDDSPVARRLLMSTLHRHFIACTVEVYGEDAKDINTFMHNALSYASIVILDQFLEYGSASFMGTDLLRTLIAQGYSGFACIRSANVSHDNQAEFLQSGAHCAIGKDIRPHDMANLISTSYLQYHASCQLTGSAFVMDNISSQDLLVPCNLPGSVEAF